MNELDVLRKEGYNISTEYELFIQEVLKWKSWYKNDVSSFHNYKVTGLNGLVEAKRSKLGMAKTVAEDWASFLFNEKTYINVDDDNAQKYLTGDEIEQEGGLFGINNLWQNGNELVERAYALGTAAIVLTLENAIIKDKNIISADIKYKYIKSPERIIPLKWDSSEIIDVAIITKQIIKDKQKINVQFHFKKQSGYLIRNVNYEISNENYKKIPFDGIEEYMLPAKAFFILTPNISNNCVDDLPMGISVYSDSIDVFKTGDLCYTNLDRDFFLGAKKIFTTIDGVATVMQNGELQPSIDKTAEQMFYVVGEHMNPEDRLFQEFNPSLRIEENTKGIQTALNIISIKCKLGPNFYNFDSESKRVYQNTSATKANTENLQRSVNRQRIKITKFIKELVENTLKIANIFNKEIKSDIGVSVQYDDTYFTDITTDKEIFFKEITAGIRKPYEYRMKFLGESEQEAKNKTNDDKELF